MSQIVKDSFSSMVLYRAQIARAMLHMLMPLMGTFISMSAVTTHDQWVAMWWLPKLAFWVGVIYNSGSNLIAFLDKTVAQMSGEPEVELQK